MIGKCGIEQYHLLILFLSLIMMPIKKLPYKNFAYVRAMEFMIHYKSFNKTDAFKWNIMNNSMNDAMKFNLLD